MAESMDEIPQTVMCWTPCPSPKPAPLLLEGPSQAGLAISRENQLYVDQARWMAILRSEISSSRISRSPTPPPSLFEPERLFFSIRAYYDVMFCNGVPVSKDKGPVASVKRVWEPLKQLSDFDQSCLIGASLISRSPVEARRLFSKGFVLVKDVIWGQHPQALSTILRILWFLGNYQCPDVGLLLRSYISRMGSVLLGKHHPWSQILTLIGKAEESDFQLIMREAWFCTCDALRHSFGRLQWDALQALISATELQREKRTVEKLILKLLDKAEQELHESDDRISYLRSQYGNCLKGLERYPEALALYNKLIARYQDNYVVHYQVAICYQNMGSEHEAEMSIRKAITLSEELNGRASPSPLNLLWLLSGWLYEWGRVEESKALRAELLGRIEPDDIDGNISQF